MTIELSGKKQRLPEYWVGNETSPASCKSDLGILNIHSKEMFARPEAAIVHHNQAYSLVLTPKITTTGDSLRDFTPKE